ncbi:FtsX-like permease family protein [Corynebacterium ciconiae DSM 44920]|uniref:FtsX-like permease family protein n=1 Tax=Corynebacterium ciconiae TaxID=227319 RepID=UPI00036A46FA|nr:FtsX-like permease family protein [Corynebacterium ciconiae]WKD61602.1 FtsX-like permease family protein [Corynebacterium ciconiae DSM 44920]
MSTPTQTSSTTRDSIRPQRVYRGAANLRSITYHVFAARMRRRDGSGLLTLLAIVAFSVISAIVMIVASGTWMFVYRQQHPRELAAQAIAADPGMEAMLGFYVFLAGFACALLIFPVLTLTSAAAVLGARMRERRLASFRLLGLSRSEINRMGTFETLVQAVVGIILGTGIALLLLPFFQRLSFQGDSVRYEEILAPFWLYLSLDLLLLGCVCISAWFGLLRVNISPLGVSRRSTPKALRFWRLIVLIVAIGALVLMPAPGMSDGPWRYLGTVLIVAVFLLAVDLVMPLLLQLASRLLARAPWLTVSWTARRVVMEPVKAWRRVSGIAAISLIIAALASAPFRDPSDPGQAEAQTRLISGVYSDITTGVISTIVFAFILAGISAMINQCSAEFERADQTLALNKIGVPSRVGLAVSWLEMIGPMVGASVVAFIFGRILFRPFAEYEEFGTHIPTIFENPASWLSIVLGGVVVMALALSVTLPVRSMVLAGARRVRRSD